MSTSGTATYNATRASIIRAAAIDVGLIGPSVSTLDPAIATAINPYLDELLKAMSRRGAPLWRQARATITIVIGTASYALPANIVNIDPPARFLQTGLTAATFVLPMPAKQYMYTSDRTNTGTPVQYYLERSLDTTGNEVMQMYLYPVPSVAGVFEYRGVAKAQDVGTDANTLDIAQEWIRCIRFGLTADLSPMAKAAVTTHQAREARFEAEFATLLNADVETADYQEVVTNNYYGPTGGVF